MKGQRAAPFHLAGQEDIKSGRVTDVYFQRTMEILRAEGIDRHVVGELFTKGLPDNWEWAVLAGVDEVAHLLEGLAVEVSCLPEGTIFRPYEPVLSIAGRYQEFGVFETAFLGLLCQASGIATKAARCRVAAGSRPVLSFGARRMHPGLAPMIERAAYIGGCDGVSAIVSADLLGIEASGTMPHALILVIGDTVAATLAFDRVIDPDVPRIALIDTFNDEKFEALRVAEALGDRLAGVRLDTPGSRRGNMRRILEEVRWELNLRGYEHVKLYVSGLLDEAQIAELNPACDGYGVGTAISAGPVVDLSFDLVEIDGRPLAKRGKMSGAKLLQICPACLSRRVVPRGTAERACPCGGEYVDLSVPLLRHGRLARPLPTPQAIRQFVLEQLDALPIATQGATNADR